MNRIIEVNLPLRYPKQHQKMSNVISAVISGSNDRKMPLDLHLPEEKNAPLVIMVHGFKGFKDWGHFPLVGDAFAAAGFAFLRFNFSHNGTTPESPSDFVDLEAFAENNLIKELDDVQIILDALRDAGLFSEASIDLSNTFIIGHSRGGGIALISSAEDDRIKGLSTWAAVNHYDREGFPLDVWEKHGKILIPNARTGQEMPMNWQFVEVMKANMNRLSIKLQSEKVNVPTLVIHGTEDPTVPYSEGKEMAGWNDSFELFTVDQADHSFGGKHPLVEETLSKHMQVVVDATIRHFKSLIP
ncbi:MAG: pimeloyl-ACP methyl ester carboxylesterase [Bacteroidia bacterium]|jgi:pimeloyl-ACP methyl ester carboxylesterase